MQKNPEKAKRIAFDTFIGAFEKGECYDLMIEHLKKFANDE